VTDEEILRLLLLDPFDPFVGALLHSAFDPPTDFPPLPHVNPLLPPIAGASPGTPWEWAWDRLQDIIRGGWDIIESVARMCADVVQGVWEWVGGSVRFVYDWLSRFSEWLGTGLSNIWGDVRTYPQRAAEWVRDRLWEAVGWVRDRVNDAANFVGQALINTANWIRDRVWDAVTWVKDRAWDAATWVAQRLWEAVTWVKDRVWDAATWVKDRAWDAARWVGDETWSMITWAGERISTAASWTVNTLLPPIMGAFGDIGDAFTNAGDALGDALGAALHDAAEAIGDAFKWPWEHIWEPFVGLLEHKLQIPVRLIRGEYASLGDVMADLIDPPQAAFLGSAGSQIFSTVIGFTTAMVLSALLQPLMVQPTQMMTERVGLSLLTVGVVQQALNRGFIDEATAADHLARAGYSGEAKQALLELRNLIPSPTDLIHMAVHEVFNPKLREELTLDDEFPEAFLPWARKLGYSEEWARNIWAGHWGLPSPSQGYEMLHRDEIEMPQLVDLIKALDYAPVWRDKLIAIAYNPITRVDLRRLYKGGIITEEEVFKGYKAQGYNDQNARYLTDYTKQYYSPEDKSQVDDFADLAVSTFRTAYRRHVITRADALDKLVDTGITEDLADFYLSIDDAQLAINPTTDAGIPVRDLSVSVIVKAYREKVWDRARSQTELEALGYLPWEADLQLQLEDLAVESDLRDLEEAVVKEEYTKRAIDRAQASSRLDALEVGTERRDLLLRRWDLQAANKTRELTVAQVQRGLKDGVFTETEVLSRFAGMGFKDVDAKFLVDDVDKTPEGQARRLSASQLSQAYKAGAITDAQFLTALVELTYSQEDAQVLVDIATPAPEAKQRQLSGAQLVAGFRAGLLTEAELLERLTAAGYTPEDAELLRDLAARQPETPARKLSVAQIKALFKAGTLDEAGVLAELLVLGYTERDAGWIRDLIVTPATTE
jgi:hypothetical protein